MGFESTLHKTCDCFRREKPGFRSTPSKVSWQDFQHNLGEVGWISTPDAVGNFLVKLHWIEIEFGEFDIYVYIYIYGPRIVFFVGTFCEKHKKNWKMSYSYTLSFSPFFFGGGSRGNLAGDLISCFLNDVFSIGQDAMFQADMRAVLLSIEVRLKGYSQQQPPKKSGGKIWVCPKIRVLVPQNGWLDDIERSFLYPGK